MSRAARFAPRLFPLVLLLSASFASSQTIQHDWVRVFDSGRTDACTGVDVTLAGDVWIVGTAENQDSTSVVVLRYLVDGSLAATAQIGSRIVHWPSGSPMIATDSYGYAIVAGNDMEPAVEGGFVARVDLGGDVEWTHGSGPVTYGDALTIESDVIHLISQFDAYYLEPELTKLDLQGQILCDDYWFGALGYVIHDVLVVDEYTVAAGSSNDSGYPENMALVAFDSSCHETWHASFAMGVPSESVAAVALTYGDFAVAGYTAVRGGTDVHVAIYRPQLWEPMSTSSFDFADGDDRVAALAKTSGDDLVLVGSAVAATQDVLIGRLDSGLTADWWRTYDGPANGDDTAVDVVALGSGGVLVLAQVEGTDGPQQALLLYDADGLLLDELLDPFVKVPNGMAMTTTGDIFTAGYNDEGAPTVPGDIIVNKYHVSPGTGIEPEASEERQLRITLVEHRPSDSSVRIRWEQPSAADVKVAVYDVSGRVVRSLASGAQLAGEHDLTWDGRSDGGESVASGVYFVRFDVGNRVERRRVVMVR